MHKIDSIFGYDLIHSFREHLNSYLKTASYFYFAGKMLGWDTEEAENVC